MFSSNSRNFFIGAVAIAFIGVATFVVYMYRAEKDQASLYKPSEHVYAPPFAGNNATATSAQGSAPLPQASNCGAGFSEKIIPAPKDGWTRKGLSSLCLTIDLPEGWFTTESSWPRLEPVAPGAIQIGLDPDEWMTTYPAAVYAVAKNSQIADISKNIEQVRSEKRNIGGSEMEVYDLDGVRTIDGNGQYIVEHEYALYAPSAAKAYVVQIAYIEQIRFKGQEIAPILLQIIRTARSY